MRTKMLVNFCILIATMGGCSILLWLTDRPAEAQLGKRDVTPVMEISISTAVMGRVAVTTHTVSRIDNATYFGLLSGRTSVRVCNESSTTNIRFGFDAYISTQTGNTRLAEKIAFGTCKNIAVTENIFIYSMAEAAAASIETVVTQGR